MNQDWQSGQWGLGLNFRLTNKSSSKLVISKKLKKYLKFLFDQFPPGKGQKLFFTKN